jgi:hypothetical protein
MKKKSKITVKDDLLPEYDFRSLPIVSRGPGRKLGSKAAKPISIVVIDPAVRDVFPDDAAVNRALRALAPVLRQQRRAARERHKKIA